MRCLLIIAALATIAVAEDAPVYTFDAVSPALTDFRVVKAGEKLVVTFTYDTGEDTTLGAFRTIAYERFLPKACAENPGWVFKENARDRNYHTYVFPEVEWRWLTDDYGVTDKTVTYELDTTGWVEGDYCLRVSLLFRTRKDADGKRVDKYVAKSFYVTITRK